jgi:hypothetical protein
MSAAAALRAGGSRVALPTTQLSPSTRLRFAAASTAVGT